METENPPINSARLTRQASLPSVYVNKVSAPPPVAPSTETPSSGVQRKSGSVVARSPSSAKELILLWVQQRVNTYPNLNVTNFSTSWNDGLAFCALIHYYYPEAFEYDKLESKNRRYNFALAFKTAEDYADICPLLEVDDMVMMKKPDWKCVFTYVQTFYRRFRNGRDPPTPTKTLTLAPVVTSPESTRKVSGLSAKGINVGFKLADDQAISEERKFNLYQKYLSFDDQPTTKSSRFKPNLSSLHNKKQTSSTNPCKPTRVDLVKGTTRTKQCNASVSQPNVPFSSPEVPKTNEIPDATKEVSTSTTETTDQLSLSEFNSKSMTPNERDSGICMSPDSPKILSAVSSPIINPKVAKKPPLPSSPPPKLPPSPNLNITRTAVVVRSTSLEVDLQCNPGTVLGLSDNLHLHITAATVAAASLPSSPDFDRKSLGLDRVANKRHFVRAKSVDIAYYQ